MAAGMQQDSWVIMVQNKIVSLVYEILSSHIGEY
jgi:hypothetical protein